MAKVSRPQSADGSHTKPMRSSPLAATFMVPMSGIDESLTITTPPICHVLPPKSCQEFDPLSTATTPRRNRPQSLYLPSSDSGLAPRTVAAEWEIDPLQRLSISRTPLRPRPSSGIHTFRLPIPIVEEEPDWQGELDAADTSSKDTSCNSSTSEITPSRSKSQPQVDSWYTTNTYDVTPRFSRLGLSAPTVIMPLSPKEHRRLSRNKGLPRTNSSSTINTTTPPKRFFIPSLSSKVSLTPARVSLEPPQPFKPLSRTLSTASSSESSSIASNSQCGTPTVVSSSMSSPSLTRSRNSEDSISTWCESLPPATPHLERDMALPGEKNGEVCEEAKEEVDVGEFGLDGHHDRDRDRDHAQFHYSDITITIQHDSNNDETGSDPRSQAQPTLTVTSSTTANASFLSPTFPKDVKKERRRSLRKKLTMRTMSMMTPLTTSMTKLPEMPVSTPTVMVTNSEDTLLSTSSISLPTPRMKKKRSNFRSVLRNFMARW